MSKKQRRQNPPEVLAVPDPIEPELTQTPPDETPIVVTGTECETQVVPRKFTPRPCSQCEALRKKGESYSYVYHTAGRVRYCKCRFCNATWTQAGD